MSNPSKGWDSELVRKWLERRLAAAKLDQAAADRRGYEAQDDYDKAAAEEWITNHKSRVEADGSATTWFRRQGSRQGPRANPPVEK